MKTVTDMVNFHNRWARAAMPATILVRSRGGGRPTKTRMARDRRSHKLMAETLHAAVFRNCGIRTEMEERRSLLTRCTRTQCVVHYLLGLIHDRAQMLLALEALRIYLVDVLCP